MSYPLQPYSIKKSGEIAKLLYIYIKSQTLFKKQDNFRYVFIDKNPDTLRYTIFQEIFEIDIYIHTKIITLCVTWRFYIKKARHFKESKTICVMFFIYKKPDTLRYAIFHGIFEIVEGGQVFLFLKNNSLFVTYLYSEKDALSRSM